MIKTLWVWIKRVIFYIWCLALIVLGMWILHENRNLVTVSYLGVKEIEQSLGVVIMQAMVFGFLLGFFTNLLSAKTRVYLQKRQAEKAKRELASLKESQPAE